VDFWLTFFSCVIFGKTQRMKELTMTNIIDIEGIGKGYAAKLAAADITTTQALLERGATPKGRQDLAEQTQISGKLILEWVNLADLLRIKGIGEEFSDLLEEAGVDTVPELAQRNPENLHQKIVEVNEAKNLVRRVPGLAQVTDWVAQAKELPRVITY
jgi:predicted flap endonuclease-1-like 5' DNA nuclease